MMQIGPKAKDSSDQVFFAAGVATISALLNGGVSKVVIEDGKIGYDVNDAPITMVEQLGRPSATMATYETPNSSGRLEGSAEKENDGGFNFSEWILFEMIKGLTQSWMAGSCAEAFHLFGLNYEHALSSDSPEYMQQMELLDGSHAQRLELRSEWYEEVKKLLKAMWPTVERVADVLRARGGLDEAEVKKLIPADTLFEFGI